MRQLPVGLSGRRQIQVLPATSEGDPLRDRLARGWILAEAEGMQELVNHDDLGRCSIASNLVFELLSANANERRAGPCERQPHFGATLRRPAVFDEPQEVEGFGWGLPARRESCREALPKFIGKVGEEPLAARVGETVGCPLDRVPYRKACGGISELQNRSTCGSPTSQDSNDNSTGEKSAAAAHGLQLSEASTAAAE